MKGALREETVGFYGMQNGSSLTFKRGVLEERILGSQEKVCYKWGSKFPCGVFKDHPKLVLEVTLGKAYEIKEFIILTNTRRGRHDTPHRGL